MIQQDVALNELSPPVIREAGFSSLAIGAHTATQGTHYGFECQGDLDHVASMVPLPLSTDRHAIHDIVVMIEWNPVGK